MSDFLFWASAIVAAIIIEIVGGFIFVHLYVFAVTLEDKIKETDSFKRFYERYKAWDEKTDAEWKKEAELW